MAFILIDSNLRTQQDIGSRHHKEIALLPRVDAMNKLPMEYELLMQPVAALSLSEETVEVLEDQGVETVSDVLDMELVYLPTAAADEVHAALVRTGLLEGEGEAPLSDPKEASTPDVEIDGTWCIVAFDGGMDDLSVAGCEAAIAQAEAAQSRVLHVLGDGAVPGTVWAEAMADHRLPAVKAFVFDNPSVTQTRQQNHSLGDLAAVLTSCPGLERLFATGALQLSATKHTALKKLWLLGSPLGEPLWQGLAGCSLDALKTLALSVTSDDPAEGDPIAALGSLNAPRLRHLTLSGLDNAAESLAHLVTLPLCKTLEGLQLEGTCDEDELLAVLKQNAPALNRIKKLRLPLGDFLSFDGMDRARDLVSSLKDSDRISDTFLPDTYLDWS
jgi:hypothetical protein